MHHTAVHLMQYISLYEAFSPVDQSDHAFLRLLFLHAMNTEIHVKMKSDIFSKIHTSLKILVPIPVESQ